MGEFVRAGEMDFPAGRMVPAVDQSRASFASVFTIQEMVSSTQPPGPCSGGRAGNDGADRLGGGYGSELAASRAFVFAPRPCYQISASKYTCINPGNRSRDQPRQTV